MTFGFKNICVSGLAINPNTVTTGQVKTRVCLRGNSPTTSHHAQTSSPIVPFHVKTHKAPSQTAAHPPATSPRPSAPSSQMRTIDSPEIRSAPRAPQPQHIHPLAAISEMSIERADFPSAHGRSTYSSAPKPGKFYPETPKEKHRRTFCRHFTAPALEGLRLLTFRRSSVIIETSMGAVQ